VREGKIVKLPKPEGHRHRDESGTVKSLKMSAPRTYYLVGHPAYRTAEMEAAHLAWQAPGKGEKARLRNEERLMYMGREIVALARSGGFLPIAYSEIG
jgi:hypothetical protein